VIEHVPDPQRSIVECARVLREGGYLYCGTPNCTRLVGYIGSRASLAEKVRWNLADWKMRLKGRFRNEYGATQASPKRNSTQWYAPTSAR